MWRREIRIRVALIEGTAVGQVQTDINASRKAWLRSTTMFHSRRLRLVTIFRYQLCTSGFKKNSRWSNDPEQVICMPGAGNTVQFRRELLELNANQWWDSLASNKHQWPSLRLRSTANEYRCSSVLTSIHPNWPSWSSTHKQWIPMEVRMNNVGWQWESQDLGNELQHQYTPSRFIAYWRTTCSNHRVTSLSSGPVPHRLIVSTSGFCWGLSNTQFPISHSLMIRIPYGIYTELLGCVLLYEVHSLRKLSVFGGSPLPLTSRLYNATSCRHPWSSAQRNSILQGNAIR